MSWTDALETGRPTALARLSRPGRPVYPVTTGVAVVVNERFLGAAGLAALAWVPIVAVVVAVAG